MKLQLGQILRGKVIEKLSESALIVSFDGTLLRVENQSRVRIEVGESVSLEIVEIDPLRFRLSGFGSLGHLARTV